MHQLFTIELLKNNPIFICITFYPLVGCYTSAQFSPKTLENSHRTPLISLCRDVPYMISLFRLTPAETTIFHPFFSIRGDPQL